MLTASRHSRAEISIRSWARARTRTSSRGQEEQGGEWYQTSCPLNMWPGLLPTRNHSSTGLHWMLALGSQPLVPPAPKSDTAWSYFLWTLEPRDAIWQQLLFATQPQITALPWMMQSHGTQGHPPPQTFLPQPCHPLLGYELQKTLLRLRTVSVGDGGGSLLLQYLSNSHVFSLVRLHTKY